VPFAVAVIVAVPEVELNPVNVVTIDRAPGADTVSVSGIVVPTAVTWMTIGDVAVEDVTVTEPGTGPVVVMTGAAWRVTVTV
jgi:hypothetical protein